MKSTILTLFALNLLLFTSSFARDGDGHESGGGYATEIDGKLRLRDFVEAGIEEMPYVEEGIADTMNARSKIDLINIPDNRVKDLTVNKLNEIYRRSPELAQLFLDTLLEYRWAIVKYKIKAANDIGQTPVHQENGFSLIPIAWRDDVQKMITIEKVLWQELDELNKVGLLFHEVVYSIARKFNGNRYSYSSRVFVGFTLFNPAFQFVEYAELMKRIQTITGGKDFFSMDASEELNCPEFQQKCDTFKRQVKAVVRKGLEIFQDIHSTYSRAVENYRLQERTIRTNYRFKDWDYDGQYSYPGLDYYRFPEIEIDGTLYTTFVANLHIPNELIGQAEISCGGCGVFASGVVLARADKKGAFKKNSPIQVFKASVRELERLSQTHQNELLGRCLNDDDHLFNLVKTSLTLKFDN